MVTVITVVIKSLHYVTFVTVVGKRARSAAICFVSWWWELFRGNFNKCARDRISDARDPARTSMLVRVAAIGRRCGRGGEVGSEAAETAGIVGGRRRGTGVKGWYM